MVELYSCMGYISVASFSSCYQNYSAVAGRIVRESLAKFFNIHRQGSSTVAGRIIQQCLARLHNSSWHDCSKNPSTITQQSLAKLSSCSRNLPKVIGMILKQLLVQLFNWVAQLFNSYWQFSSTFTDTIVTKTNCY